MAMTTGVEPAPSTLTGWRTTGCATSSRLRRRDSNPDHVINSHGPCPIGRHRNGGDGTRTPHAPGYEPGEGPVPLPAVAPQGVGSCSRGRKPRILIRRRCGLESALSAPCGVRTRNLQVEGLARCPFTPTERERAAEESNPDRPLRRQTRFPLRQRRMSRPPGDRTLNCEIKSLPLCH
jgi:hypothetical protein